MKQKVDARKERLGKSDLKGLLKDVTKVVVAKGKKITTFNLAKGEFKQADLAAAMIGPTGNLRAPTLRRGKKLLVGFHAEEYEEFLR